MKKRVDQVDRPDRQDDDKLDEALEETFPASDPIPIDLRPDRSSDEPHRG
ncbi:hypothetical protein LJR034_001434 [Caballeronia sp. LjRoot34]